MLLNPLNEVFSGFNRVEQKIAWQSEHTWVNDIFLMYVKLLFKLKTVFFKKVKSLRDVVNLFYS